MTIHIQSAALAPAAAKGAQSAYGGDNPAWAGMGDVMPCRGDPWHPGQAHTIPDD